MQTAKTLIITGLIGLVGMLTQVEAASTNYEHCTASAEDGFTHLLIGDIKVVADNSLPPCPY